MFPTYWESLQSLQFENLITHHLQESVNQKMHAYRGLWKSIQIKFLKSFDIHSYFSATK